MRTRAFAGLASPRGPDAPRTEPRHKRADGSSGRGSGAALSGDYLHCGKGFTADSRIDLPRGRLSEWRLPVAFIPDESYDVQLVRARIVRDMLLSRLDQWCAKRCRHVHASSCQNGLTLDGVFRAFGLTELLDVFGNRVADLTYCREAMLPQSIECSRVWYAPVKSLGNSGRSGHRSALTWSHTVITNEYSRPSLNRSKTFCAAFCEISIPSSRIDATARGLRSPGSMPALSALKHREQASLRTAAAIRLERCSERTRKARFS